MKKSKIVSTSVGNVVQAASDNPQIKGILKTLFPDAFRDDTLFLQLGSLFARRKYPDNVYAIICDKTSSASILRVLNITYGTYWQQGSNIMLRKQDLKRNNSVTVSEFKSMTGYGDLSDFYKVVVEPTIRLSDVYQTF